MQQAPLLDWFALRVRSGLEKTTSLALRGKGYEEFLPLYVERRRWSDRIKEIETPLIPGYVFCRCDLAHRLPILTTPGVMLIVGIGKTPAAISEREIESLKAIVKSGLPSEPWRYLEVGQRVRIDDGPLRDVEGTLIEVKQRHRLVVSVHLLQRSVAVEIDRQWATPLPPVRSAAPQRPRFI